MTRGEPSRGVVGELFRLQNAGVEATLREGRASHIELLLDNETLNDVPRMRARVFPMDMAIVRTWADR